MSYDGWWENGEKRREENQRQLDSEYWTVIKPNGSLSGKYLTSEEAKQSIMVPGFEWRDFEAKGYQLKKINVDQIRRQQRELNKYL